MKKTKRKWDLLSKAKRQACLEEIISYFREEKDEQLGLIAAEDMLDFFLEMMGEEIYNKGVEDSKQLLFCCRVPVTFFEVKELMIKVCKIFCAGVRRFMPKPECFL